MFRRFCCALMLVASTLAIAGNPTPLTIQIDRTQEPNIICANRLTSGTGCMPIGSMDVNGNYVPFRNGKPVNPGETVVCGVPGTIVSLPAGLTTNSLLTVSDCGNKITSALPLQINAPSDATIGFNPATGQVGSFTSITFTIPGQAATFFLASPGVLGVK